MIIRPILFTGPMVRALLNGSKTQTRRIAKLTEAGHVKEVRGHRRWHTGDKNSALASPFGQPGDRLWVREAWSHDAASLEQCRASYEDAMGPGSYGPYYRATETAPDTLSWKPSIHMPRWASRLTLEITSVRVERLQDISEADAIAEGCTKNHNGYYWGGPHPEHGLKQMATAVSAYRDLWQSINGPDSWAANPWVWVVEFKRVKP